MLTTSCQRWRERRDSYRPAGEVINTKHYEVAVIERDIHARPFVKEHHYSGSYPAARFRVGLYRRSELVGVAVLSVPSSQSALRAGLPFPHVNGAELGRFVLLDDVPANGESWFLAQAFALARAAGFDAIVSHSDPMPRTNNYGQLIFLGHIGTIYQASNATYVGMTPRRTRRFFGDGTVLDRRSISKLQARERGTDYVVAKLLEYGAPKPRGNWEAWCTAAIKKATLPIRHTGSHRYLFALERGLRKHLPDGQRYPKIDVAPR